VGTNESVGLAGPIKISRGWEVQSAVANAPVSPVYTNCVGLGSTAMKVNIDTREIKPLHIEMHRQRGVLPVGSTALAMAKALVTGLR